MEILKLQEYKQFQQRIYTSSFKVLWLTYPALRSHIFLTLFSLSPKFCSFIMLSSLAIAFLPLTHVSGSQILLPSSLWTIFLDR